MKKINMVMLFTSLLLMACTEQPPQQSNVSARDIRTGSVHTPVPVPPPLTRPHDFATELRGGNLYQQFCASCHGQQAQGSPQWQRPDASGKYPPPPLNGTGHAWHHPMEDLKMTVRQGTLSRGGNMPAWGDKLSDKDIEAIIAWLQSKWPDELYGAWREMDARARASRTSR